MQELELQSKQREFDKNQEELNLLKRRLKAEREKYKINKKEQELKIMSSVKQQFDEYVKQLNQLENKQHGAQEIKEQLSNELKTTKDLLHNNKRKQSKKASKVKQGNLKKGDQVKWIQNDQVGEVLELKKSKAVVAFGSIKTMISTNDLLKLEGQVTPKKAKIKVNRKVSKEPEVIHFEIDLRGMRYEEAEIKLIGFFDKAVLI